MARLQLGTSWGGGRRRHAVAKAVSAVAAASGMVAMALSAGIAAPTNDPTTDPYSMAAITQNMGAEAFWNAGYTGRGVDVAVIDSGVTPVEGLSGPDKIVNGPDLSFDSQFANLEHLDGYGHGTYMAGLIAGRDTNLATPYASAPASQYRGVAPDARIVNVKAGASDGAVDVTQVIAGIAWVVQHKNDNGMNIRVLNLSYGTDSKQAYTSDPLAFAIEQAWKAGIFVVVSAGNDGYVGGSAGNLAMPAQDPTILAVGGADTSGTAGYADDTMGAWSAKGSKKRHVDLVAPGAHLQGLRVPGSYIADNHPEGRINDRFFRGSGTSQAAAIVSGAAALAIQQRPTITPGQLKLLLMRATVGIVNNNNWQGTGELDLTRALSAPSTGTDPAHTPSTGTGTIEASRGSDHVSDNGIDLTGEKDIFGAPFNTAQMAAAQAARTSWNGGTWNGNEWTGSTWSSRTWSSRTWSSRTWSSRTWSGATWDGHTWSSRTWSGSGWTSRRWSGHTWSDGAWT